jgi:hypothetical protein
MITLITLITLVTLITLITPITLTTLLLYLLHRFWRGARRHLLWVVVAYTCSGTSTGLQTASLQEVI